MPVTMNVTAVRSRRKRSLTNQYQSNGSEEVMDEWDIDNRFGYHKPDDQRAKHHEEVRSVLIDAAKRLDAIVPDGRECSLMMTALEEAMMWGNAGIARYPQRLEREQSAVKGLADTLNAPNPLMTLLDSDQAEQDAFDQIMAEEGNEPDDEPDDPEVAAEG
jgi:hypothetical protein